VAQREDPELEGGARSEAGAERRDEGDEDRLHDGSKLAHLGATTKGVGRGGPDSAQLP